MLHISSSAFIYTAGNLPFSLPGICFMISITDSCHFCTGRLKRVFLPLMAVSSGFCMLLIKLFLILIHFLICTTDDSLQIAAGMRPFITDSRFTFLPVKCIKGKNGICDLLQTPLPQGKIRHALLHRRGEVPACLGGMRMGCPGAAAAKPCNLSRFLYGGGIRG